MKETSTHIYFWGGIYSQWYKCSFESNDSMGKYYFNTAEQYMMFHKASLFGDNDIASKILQAKDPGEQKALGREVKGFDEAKWNEHKYEIVVQGNFLKFTQNETLKKQLLSTNAKVLVEGSPYDRVWGVGLKWDDPAILDESNWRGQNLLGKALMDVRKKLQEG